MLSISRTAIFPNQFGFFSRVFVSLNKRSIFTQHLGCNARCYFEKKENNIYHHRKQQIIYKKYYSTENSKIDNMEALMSKVFSIPGYSKTQLGQVHKSVHEHFREKNFEVTPEDDENQSLNFEELAASGNPFGQTEMGFKYYKENNQAKAFEYFQLAADQNYAPALHILGTWYLFETKEERKGIEYLQLAAQNNYSIAQRDLGNCYIHGIGVDKGVSKGIDLLNAAATQKLPNANCDLGVLYYEGKLVEQNYQEAVRHFLLAAEKGFPLAHYYLGLCFMEGTGVRLNIEKGIHHLLEASSLPDALYTLGSYYIQQGNDIVEGRELLLKAIKSEHCDSMCYLAELYYYGAYGFPADVNEALPLWEKAATFDFPDAHFALGRYHYDIQDYPSALSFLSKAVLGPVPEAEYLLGTMYSKGLGTSVDHQLAFEYFQKAFEHGHMQAISQLGDCYFYGNGVSNDYSKAVEYYKMFDNAKDEECDPHALTQLALCYTKALGVSRNPQQAEYYKSRAKAVAELQK